MAGKGIQGAVELSPVATLQKTAGSILRPKPGMLPAFSLANSPEGGQQGLHPTIGPLLSEGNLVLYATVWVCQDDQSHTLSLRVSRAPVCGAATIGISDNPTHQCLPYSSC